MHLDSANAVAWYNSHADVATLAPRGTPRVLYGPVFGAVISDAISDCEHGVIMLITAKWVGQDSTSVALEDS